LNVSTSDGFAGRWLVPRLYRFHRDHDDIDVRVSTTGKLTNFLADGIDVAIRYGGGSYPGLTSEFLTGEEIFPVCSPNLLEGAHRLRTPDDLKYHTLIHHGFPWAAWLESAGVEGVDTNSGITFDSTSFAMESAAQGEGVVLGRTMLVAADLASGRLVRPFGHAMKSPSSFYVVYPPDAIRQRKVKAFRDWLLSEVTPHVD
jgi:LysR family glycine cleavage system transcriptional activator